MIILIILTIFDKEEGKIIQYLSDSVEKFRDINQMEDISVRKRYVKESSNFPENENGKEMKRLLWDKSS